MIIYVIIIAVIISVIFSIGIRVGNKQPKPVSVLKLKQNKFPSNSRKKRIIRVGHRGAAGYADENTLESFAEALELGVDMIKFDIHQTLDNRFVVIHDKYLDQTTNETGLVADKTWTEISKYRTKQNNRIPLLEEAIEFIGSKAIINIEIKNINNSTIDNRSNPTRDGIRQLAKLIDNYLRIGWNSDQFVISSFDHCSIYEFKRYHPDIHTLALTKLPNTAYIMASNGDIITSFNSDIHTPAFIKSLSELNVCLEFKVNADTCSVGISQDFVSKAFIDEVHQHKMLVFVYTLNTINDINQVLALGADGIISDYPDLIPVHYQFDPEKPLVDK